MDKPNTLDNVEYNFDKPVNIGSVGCLVAVIKNKTGSFNPKTPFGKECIKNVVPLVKPVINSVENLYDFSLKMEQNSENLDMLRTIFFEDFDHKQFKIPFRLKKWCFVRGGGTDHNKARTSTLVHALILRLRVWSNILKQSGWYGVYWKDLFEFQKELNKVLELIPEPVEKTFLIKDKNVSEEVLKENPEKGFKEVKKDVEPLVEKVEIEFFKAAQFSKKQESKKKVERLTKKQRKELKKHGKVAPKGRKTKRSKYVKKNKEKYDKNKNKNKPTLD